MQIHHASQSGGESKSVLDASVSVQPHQCIALRDVVQKTESQRVSRPFFFLYFFVVIGRVSPVFIVGEKRVGPNQKNENRFMGSIQSGHLLLISLHPNLATKVATESEDDVFFLVCKSQPFVSPILIEAQC